MCVSERPSYLNYLEFPQQRAGDHLVLIENETWYYANKISGKWLIIFYVWLHVEVACLHVEIRRLVEVIY